MTSSRAVGFRQAGNTNSPFRLPDSRPRTVGWLDKREKYDRRRGISSRTLHVFVLSFGLKGEVVAWDKTGREILASDASKGRDESAFATPTISRRMPNDTSGSRA
jgi:hypothetical protein